MKTLKFTPDLLTGRLSEDDAKKYFSRFGWFAVVFNVAITAFQMIAITLLQALAPSLLSNYLISEILSLISIYAVAFPIALLVLAPLPTVTPVKEKMRTRDFVCAVCICEALMLVGSYISSFVLSVFSSFLGGASFTNPLASSVESQPLWATLLFTAILAPLLEEIFFRGAVCKKLLILGEGYAVVLSSAFFALCHGNFFQLFYSFIIGCFFGFIYVKTGKLRYTVMLHMIVNLIGTVVVTLVLDFADIESWLSDTFEVTAENMYQVLAFVGYEAVILGASIFGLIMLFKNKKRIRFDSGLLPPPERRGVSCVMMNSGVAVAIAIFAFSLLGSLLI